MRQRLLTWETCCSYGYDWEWLGHVTPHGIPTPGVLPPGGEEAVGGSAPLGFHGPCVKSPEYKRAPHETGVLFQVTDPISD